MRKQKRLFKSILSFALALALLIPLAGPAAVLPSSAVTQAEIDALKSDASKLAGQKKDIQSQLKAVRADKSKAMDQKKLLEQQIGIIQSEIDNINAQIAKYEELIAQRTQELEQTQAQEQEQFQLFCQRMRQMEEAGETSYWGIIFGAQDFSELLDNYMMVEEIIEYDNGVIQALEAIQAQVEQERAEIEEDKRAEEAAKLQEQEAQAELKEREAEVDKLIAQISEQEDDLEAKEEELKKAANAADAQIKKMEKELAAQIKNVPSESGFLWPLNASYNTLTSLYGPRIHPVTGKPNNHTGVDIPAPRNTKIYAAKSGVVTTSVYGSGSSWSYGNYVVVSHSDGTSTLYAHMNSRAVSQGQTVKQGDVIGYVGTTGRSTGNHLHFEVRVNGNRVDPLNYFKDKTLYARSGGKTMKLDL